MYFIKYSLILSLATASLFSSQLSNKSEWFTAKDQRGNTVKYAGQAATNSTILLTPSNGFFSSGIRANGKSQLVDSETSFITGDFATLERWDKPVQTMRWHFWAPETGKITVKLQLEDVKPGSTITVTLGEQTQDISAVSGN